ncbi:MAG: hypothetical protein ACJZ47_06595, partial [bacterium]
TLIGKVKESQKKKQVLRLKKRLTSLRTLLVKVKGFSAFESSRIKQRKMEAMKLLEKKSNFSKGIKEIFENVCFKIYARRSRNSPENYSDYEEIRQFSKGTQ